MKYDRHTEIGKGGLAIVYRVYDERDKRWALKKLRTDIADSKQEARFRQEIRIQSELAHPHIVPVVASNALAPRPFYIMPLADGNLEDDIPDISKNPSLLRPIAEGLMSALSYAHSEKVLHRDLKPSNVLRYGTTYQVSDFGLGKVLDGKASYETTEGDKWLTLWYAPPEQHIGLAECDARSDIFSLGKVFLHCLTGKRPSSIPSEVDSRWQYLLRKCLRDPKEDRWPSIDELIRQYRLVFNIDAPIVIDPDDLLGQLAKLARKSAPLGSKDLDKIAAQVAMLSDDTVLLKKVFVAVPSNLIEAWCKHDAEGFRRFFKQYDEIAKSNSSFAYCDTIADHYYLVHTQCHDLEIRQLVRERLFELGPNNNRWHVGEVLGKILATIRDAGEIASVITMIEGDARSAKWNASYIRSASIDRRIRDVLVATTSDASG